MCFLHLTRSRSPQYLLNLLYASENVLSVGLTTSTANKWSINSMRTPDDINAFQRNPSPLNHVCQFVESLLFCMICSYKIQVGKRTGVN